MGRENYSLDLDEKIAKQSELDRRRIHMTDDSDKKSSPSGFEILFELIEAILDAIF